MKLTLTEKDCLKHAIKSRIGSGWAYSPCGHGKAIRARLTEKGLLESNGVDNWPMLTEKAIALRETLV